MATKRKIESWINQIEKRMSGIATERDKLDDMISTMEELKEDCTRAHDALQEARDALSELV